MKPTYKTFKIDISTENVDNFLKFVEEKYPFKEYYNPTLAIKIKKHYHKAPEARLFLEGEGVFVLEGEELVCGPGTYIELDPGLIHSFYSTKPFKAVRFNTKYEDWTAIDVD